LFLADSGDINEGRCITAWPHTSTCMKEFVQSAETIQTGISSLSASPMRHRSREIVGQPVDWLR
jgi:hypothetical protein